MLLRAQRFAQEFAAALKMIGPPGQFRRWRLVPECRQKHSGIDRSIRSFEHSANCNHADHAMVTHEAMLDKCPLAIPAYQARLNLDGLKCLEIAAKLGDCIAHHREGSLPSRDAKRAALQEPVDASDVGERKISTVVDMEVYVQVIGPHA